LLPFLVENQAKPIGHRFTFPQGATMARKYGHKAQTAVKEAMHERKHGTLKSGKSGNKVTSKQQAIAIGLSKARDKGAKVPAKK
jgi:hypothetical protein